MLFAGWLGINPGLGAAPARLAIIAESQEMQTATDLLTATLSTVDGLTLLERGQIEKVRQEQQLTALSTKNSVKLGQVLGADGVLVLKLDKLDGQTVLFARLAAVKPGVVLKTTQYPWPLKSLEDWSKLLPKQYAGMWPKLQVAAADAVPVSILNLRSAIKSVAGERLERDLTLLLINRLISETELFVLERRGLQWLAQEKEYKTTDDSPFWNGAYLLDGILDKSGYSTNTVTVSVRLVPPKGGTPIEIELSGNRTNLQEVVDVLAKKIMEGLHKTPQSTIWNPEAEAAQYLAEAQWAMKWKMHESAQAASEAAWAMGLRSQDLAIIRIHSYVDPLYVYRHAKQEAAATHKNLEQSLRAMEVFMECYAISLNPNLDRDKVWLDTAVKVLTYMSEILVRLYNENSRPSALAEPMAKLRTQVRAVAEMVENDFPPAGLFDYYSLKITQGAYWQETPEAGMAMYQQMVSSPYYYMARTQLLFKASSVLDNISWDNRGDVVYLVGWTSLERAKSMILWRRLVYELANAPDLSMRMEGLCLSLNIALTPQDLNQSIDKLWSFFEEHRSKFLSGEWDPQIIDDASQGAAKCYHLNSFSSIGNWRANRSPHPDSKSFLHPVATVSGPVTNTPPVSNSPASVTTNAAPATPRPVIQSSAPEKLGPPAPLGPPGAIGRRPSPAPTIPPEPETINVKQYYDLASRVLEAKIIKIISAFYRNGKIWCELRSEFRHTAAGEGGIYRACVSLDPQSGNIDVLTLPATVLRGRYPPVPSVEVLGDGLFVNMYDCLKRYDLKRKQWEPVPIPCDKDVYLQAVGDRLYLCDQFSISEYHPGDGFVKILASNRRKPPQTALDKLETLDFPIVIAGPGGGVQAYVKNGIYRYDSAIKDWVPARQITTPYYRKVEGGILFQCPSIGSLPRTYGLRTNGAFELLFEHPSGSYMLNRPGAYISGASKNRFSASPKNSARLAGANPQPQSMDRLYTQWNVPIEYLAVGGAMDFDGPNLWVLGPILRASLFSNFNNRNAGNNSVRTTALWYFDSQLPDPLQMKLVFPPAHANEDFSNVRGFHPSPNTSYGRVQLLNTPEGLAILRDRVEGIWFIPRTDLDNAIKRALAKTAVKSPRPL